MIEVLSYLELAMVMVTTLELLISRNIRLLFIFLIVQYVAVFLLTMQYWSVGLAAIKLIAGLIAGTVLLSAQPNVEREEAELVVNSESVFRLLVSLLVWTLVFILEPSVQQLLAISNSVLWSGFILIGMGLLQLGMTMEPPRVIVGLLTVLSGFEVIYAAVENSVLVAGLLAVITLGLALVGAYLIISKPEEAAK
ncbi:MAG TPA: hypothetical protein VMC62_11670 [Longilinea sp.]|nr:hypothetical protein [Longilinea sp.]